MKESSPVELKHLYDAVLSLKTEQECAAFFEDILSPNEMSSITQRLQVAIMLRDGKPFLEITQATGASTATIGRVSRCLKKGSGGYKTVLERMK